MTDADQLPLPIEEEVPPGRTLVEELPISVRTFNALENRGVKYLDDLERLGIRGLLRIKGLGKTCLHELEEVLAERKIYLTYEGEGVKYELRLCGACGYKHRWEIIGYNSGVPLYNARPTKTCATYRPFDEETMPDVSGLPVDTQALWAQTGDLNAQATMATRLVVARLKSLANGKSGVNAIAAQWPDFIGFVISQITDMRGALVRDESKFAHLVAHTDEIVESLRDGVRLKEQLRNMSAALTDIYAKLEELGPRQPAQIDVEAFAHFGLVEEGLRPYLESLRLAEAGFHPARTVEREGTVDDDENGDEEMEPTQDEEAGDDE